MILELVVAWSLDFTAPAFDAKLADSCPVGCTAAGVSSSACADAARFEVWSYGQPSPTFAAHAAGLRADFVAGRSDSMRALWPAIASEAAPRLVASRVTSPSEAGRACEVELPDSLPRGRVYFVVTLDAAGNRSCASNAVAR